MSTQPPSGPDPYDPRYPERLPPGFSPPSDDQIRYQSHPSSAGPGSGDPLVATDLAGWFERMVGTVRRSLAPLLVLHGGYAVVGVLFQMLYGDKLLQLAQSSETDPQAAIAQLQAVVGELLLPGLAVMLLSLFVTTASMCVIIRQAAGGTASVGQALAFAGRRMPLVVAWGLAAFLLTMIGFMLFLLPGIFLAIVFSAGLLGAVVVERRGIDRVFPLVLRRFPGTLGRVLLLVVAMGVYSIVVNLLVSGVGPGPESFIGAVVGAALGIPLGMAQSAFLVVTYAELRRHENPEVDTRRLASEMEAA